MTVSSNDADEELLNTISSSFMIHNVDFGPPSEDVIEYLKFRWTTIIRGPLFRNLTRTLHWWDRIVNLHSEPDRRYHTLVHLFEMMGYVDLLQQSDNPTMTMAVFFHDAIYNTTSATNEEESSKLFMEFCNDADCSNQSFMSEVEKYILRTKHHTISEEDVVDPNLATFLDIDMAVLGKDEAAYLHYASLIRQEYHFVEQSVYCEKRSNILSAFLGQTHIFASPSMRNALESRARRNLQREIRLLKAGTIPGESEM